MILPLAIATLPLACGRVSLSRPVPVDPEATFAAHREHGRIAFDRLAPERSGALRPPGWLRLPGEPMFVLESDGKRTAAFWRDGNTVDARRQASREAPQVGEVVSSWVDQTIRLELKPAGGAAVRSDAFLREGVGATEALTRATRTVLDVRGTYRAALHDASNAPAGWIRVRISPYQEASRIFDGVLPAAMPPEVAAAAVIALDVEIDWIEDHALDVYRGASGGALERSIPSPR